MTQDLQSITPRQAAKFLGKSPQTMAHWRYAGKGSKYTRISGTVRYFLKDLEEYVASRTVSPQEGDAA